MDKASQQYSVPLYQSSVFLEKIFSFDKIKQRTQTYLTGIFSGLIASFVLAFVSHLLLSHLHAR